MSTNSDDNDISINELVCGITSNLEGVEELDRLLKIVTGGIKYLETRLNSKIDEVEKLQECLKELMEIIHKSY